MNVRDIMIKEHEHCCTLIGKEFAKIYDGCKPY
jgi:hypothetical protein